jgi:hypothetical protein
VYLLILEWNKLAYQGMMILVINIIGNKNKNVLMSVVFSRPQVCNASLIFVYNVSKLNTALGTIGAPLGYA